AVIAPADLARKRRRGLVSTVWNQVQELDDLSASAKDLHRSPSGRREMRERLQRNASMGGMDRADVCPVLFVPAPGLGQPVLSCDVVSAQDEADPVRAGDPDERREDR